jgi:Spy/CpxP family protein refolding chaperone
VNKIILTTVILFALLLGVAIGHNLDLSASPEAESNTSPTPSAYRDLLASEIRGMDAETIEGYLAGSGLGMALPAELNGYPGPRHVLELAEDLKITPEQQRQVQHLFDQMQPQAIDLGKQILEAEAALEQAFRTETITEATLEQQLAETGRLEAQLRFIHLRTHLATLDILSPHQVMAYNRLRGYDEMPAGHQHQHN